MFRRHQSTTLDWGEKTGLGINAKMMLTLVALGLVVVIAATTVGYQTFTSSTADQYYEKAQQAAYLAAQQVDPDNFDKYLDTEVKTLQYTTNEKSLQRINDSFGCIFIYVVRLTEDESGYQYIYEVVDAGFGYSPRLLGYVDPVEDQNYFTHFKEALAGGEVDDSITIDYPTGGSTPNVVAYQPLYDSDGAVAGMLVVELPMTELYPRLNNFLLTMILAGLLDILVFVTLIGFVIYRKFMRPIRQIQGEARRFVMEKARPSDRLLSIRNRDEIGALARTVTKMEYETADYLKHLAAVTAEKERAGTQLAVATQIQASTLPTNFPTQPAETRYQLFASMTPAKEVGGDFYDFFTIDENHLGLVIADVSGKGIPAALFMMMSKLEIKNIALTGLEPAEVLNLANEHLCTNNTTDMFVTVWLGIYDLTTHVITCANAGHEYPALCRAGEAFQLYPDKHKLALGCFAGISYAQYDIQLELGDTLFVYTDGVAEATNSQDQLYGTDRMLATLNTLHNQDAQAVTKGLVADVLEFTGDAEQFDDITALCFRVIE